ncbi:hypothetical protein [Aliikangiella coralliicola]|uniref:Uncharacterized protein n=1 Tax=Aliikangiella coralliicola TaxID=2592383 RepID=A0A545UA63_9GAMM|nr:hypothetical protein [Aliikangiella coralliicola]TQV86368.1 hypothetical protein FLL46_15715 [Aliikangiella coralliicola]
MTIKGWVYSAILLCVLTLFPSIVKAYSENVDEYYGRVSVLIYDSFYGNHEVNSGFAGKTGDFLHTKLKHSDDELKKIRQEYLKSGQGFDTFEYFSFSFTIEKIQQRRFEAYLRLSVKLRLPEDRSAHRTLREHRVKGWVGIDNQYEFSYEDDSSLAVALRVMKPSERMLNDDLSSSLPELTE